jgi:rubrerythrin
MDNLEFERVMSVAIARELEANQFYSSVAKKFDDGATREVFAKLAAEEMGHMELLEKFKNDPTMVMKISAPPVDFKLAESMELPKISTAMKPADAIALAMKKEQQAVEFYRDLSKNSKDSAVKAIFDNLANMELNHKKMLENAFVDIGYPEAFCSIVAHGRL